MFGICTDMLVCQLLQKEQETFPPFIKLEGCLGAFITGLILSLGTNELLVTGTIPFSSSFSFPKILQVCPKFVGNSPRCI